MPSRNIKGNNDLRPPNQWLSPAGPLLTKLGIYQNEHAINYDVTFFGLGPFHLHTSDSDAAFSTDARLGGTWWLTEVDPKNWTT